MPRKLTRREFMYISIGGITLAGIGAALWLTGSLNGERGMSNQRPEASPTQQLSGELSILARSGYHQELHEKGLFVYYKQLRPEVTFKYVPKAYSDTYQTALLAMRNKSTEYDVMYLDEPWIYEFYVNKWLEPVGDVDTAGIPDLVAKHTYYDGKYYGVPITGNFNFLFYNKAIIESVGEAPPRSWDDVIRVAETVNQRLAPNTYGWSGNYPGGVATDVYITVLLSLGGHVFDPKDKVTPVLDSNEAVEALKIIKELASPKRAHPKTMSWPNLTEYSDAILLREVAMGMVWNGWVKDVDNPQRSKVVGEIEIVPAPGKRRVSQTGIWYYTISTYSTKKELARDYIRIATSYQAQKYAHLNAGLPPTRITVFQDPEVQQGSRLAKYFVDIANAAVPGRTSPVWMKAEEYINQQLNKAVLGELTPEEAVKNSHRFLVEQSEKLGLI